MKLREALINQGNDLEVIDDIINEMISEINEGRNPDDILEEYGLEPDYVLDLLEECI